jgi:GT2 family glycosyltransferase
MLISVIITCFCEGELLLEAVESAIEQTQLPHEIVIVYDASGDRSTIDVCKQLESYPLIKVIWREENGGTSVARDDGFSHARGEILVPLDADDLLPKEALELISKTFENNPDAEFVYGNYLKIENISDRGQEVKPGKIGLEKLLQSKSLSLSSNWNLIGTTPLKRTFWQKIGGYDLTFGVEDLHDVEFWIRAIAASKNYVQIDQIIYIWRKYLGSNSQKVTPLSWYRIAQKHQQIYAQNGLATRAQELILLGSKWQNRSKKEIQTNSQALIRLLLQHNPTFSGLLILIIPGYVWRVLAKLAIANR